MFQQSIFCMSHERVAPCAAWWHLCKFTLAQQIVLGTWVMRSLHHVPVGAARASIYLHSRWVTSLLHHVPAARCRLRVCELAHRYYLRGQFFWRAAWHIKGSRPPPRCRPKSGTGSVVFASAGREHRLCENFGDKRASRYLAKIAWLNFQKKVTALLPKFSFGLKKNALGWT
jgi:hypothetical protein